MYTEMYNQEKKSSAKFLSKAKLTKPSVAKNFISKNGSIVPLIESVNLIKME